MIVGVSAGGGSDSEKDEKNVAEASNAGDVKTDDTNNTDADSTTQNDAETNVTEADAEETTQISGNQDITIESQVLADANGIKVTATGIESGFMGLGLKVQVENTGDKTVTVQVRDVSINGLMMQSTIFSCDIAPGKLANDEISFLSSEMEMAGIETVGLIELKVHAFNTETWDTLFTTDAVSIETSANGTFEQKYDSSGFTAVDQDGLKIVMKKLESEDSFWGADLYVYVENNTDKDLTVQVRDVSINGVMVDPIFSCEVVAGKKAFDSITFMESDLTENGITDITQMDLKYHVFETNGMNTILDTEVISVEFN